MITAELYGFLMLVTLSLIFLSYFIKGDKKEIGQVFRLGGSVLLLFLSYPMLQTQITYNVGALIIENDSITTTVDYITTDFGSEPVAVIMIILSLALIIHTAIKMYENKFDDEKEEQF